MTETTDLLDCCDVPGCEFEWDVKVGDEKRCLMHAKEKALQEEANKNVKH